MANDVKYPDDVPLVWPATVTRTGARKGGPWKTAQVETVVPRAVKPGERITVLPLKRAVAARDLPVTAVEEQAVAAPFPPTWTVAADASVAAFLTARPEAGHQGHRPFEVVVVYPASRRARLLAPESVAHDLPAPPATLWAAVDLTGDGKPDAAIFRFCCEQPSTAPRATGNSPCGSECLSIYVRSAGQPWRLAHQASDD
jgi:hypothetical protein